MAADLDPSAPLCLCGIRACASADQHAAAFVATNRPRRGRNGRRTRKR